MKCIRLNCGLALYKLTMENSLKSKVYVVGPIILYKDLMNYS